MNPQLQSRQRSVLSSISDAASAILVIVGSLVLAGWIFDIPLLKSVSPGWVSMKVNTAVCFVLTGISLWCLRDEQATPRVRGLGHACAALVVLVTLPTLGEYLLAVDYGIDQLLMQQPAAASDPATPGRMSAATAFAFLLTAIALLGLDWKNRHGHRPVLAFALLTAVIGLLGIAGYTYGVKSLHAFLPFSSLAVHTAALLIVASVGILCARPDRGPLGILTAQGIGSTMARRILPLAIVLPFLIGWLRMRGEQEGFYGFEFGLALFATSNAIIFAFLIWITGVSLNRGDAERKRSTAAAALLSAIVESSDDAIIGKDLNGIVTNWNTGAERIFGYAANEIVGRSILLLIPPERQEEEHEILRRIRRGERVDPIETVRAGKDGRPFEVSITVSVIKDGSGKIVGASKVARDITGRKQIEEEIRETRNFLASVFDNIPNMISVKDAHDLRFVRLNSAGEKLIGHSEKELLGKSDHDFFPKDQADFFVARDREALASGGALFVTEEALTAKDGSTKLLQTKKLPILDKNGSPQYLLAISEDITERQRATHALATERTLLRTLVDAMPDAIYTKDTASHFTMCNSAAFRHSGLATEAEIIGKSAFDLYPRTIAENYQADDVKVIAGETVLNREEASVNAEGVENWFLTTKVPLRDHAGEIVGIVGISRDITQRKVAEQQLRESENKYRQLIEQASDGIFVSDAEGNFVMVNTRGSQLLGYAPGELVGLNGKVTYLEEETAIHTRRMAAVVVGDDLRFERMVRRKDGTAFPAEVSIKMLDNGMVQVIFHDITTRRIQEQKIARLSRIQQVLSGINSAIVRIRDRQELFEEACRIAVEHGGFSIALIALLDHVSGTLMLVAQAGLPIDLHAGGDSSSRSIGLLPRGVAEVALREKGPAFDNDIENKPDLLNGEIGPDTLNVRRAAVRLGAKSVVVLPLFVEGQTFGILTLFTPERNFFDDAELKLLSELAGDISFSLEFIAKEEKVDYLAYYDSLTGLPNRSLFFDRLTHQIGTATREHSNVALVLMDLDRFRLINDTLGRQAGDALIGAVAHRIRETFRDQDTLARVGADSFAAAVSGTWKAPDAAHFLEAHNRQMFGEPFVLGREELRVSATAGIAVFPGDGDSPETLFANAEAALRKAKEENARFLFYSPDMNARVADSLRLENKLRQALENGEMVLWYQPKVDVKTRKLAGFEALMRWQDPETGMVPPARFIPLMEQTGLILEAGRWALLQVSRDCRLWVTNGIRLPRIAVNVSPIQLRQKNFVATIVEAAEKAEEAGALLDLEITESVIMENVETIIPMLQTVRGLGVEIAVDDFGTGYSSLAYIARLPIQALKIDRSFVVGMTQSQDSLAIVRSVISLAHALRLHVIAEGVETEEQAALLLQLECDEMQGYLFSKPVPPGEVPALVRKLTQG